MHWAVPSRPEGRRHVSPDGVSISQTGITLGVDPQQGATVGVGAGDAGGVNVGAGPQGVTSISATRRSSFRRSHDRVGNTLPQPRAGSARARSPRGRRARPAPGNEPGRRAVGPAVAPGRTPRARQAQRSTGGDARVLRMPGREPRRRTASRGAQPAAARDDSRGVRAGPGLHRADPAGRVGGSRRAAMIALAMWLMWVRGRRRLEHNAYVDADTGVTNVAAFETFLAGEWARSVRYQRPLGLLLLQLEGIDPGGGACWKQAPAARRGRRSRKRAGSRHGRAALATRGSP